MPLIEQIYNPNGEEAQLLNLFLSHDFPFYYVPSTTNHHDFVHTLIHRNPTDELDGIENSICAPMVKKLFNDFCEKNKISYDVILRAALNCSTYKVNKDGTPHGDIHKDHEFKHFIFIMYLNDCTGDTYIFDENKNLVEQIKPEKNKIAIFEGLNHAQGFCDLSERRVVLVITFISKFLENLISRE